MRSRDSWIVKKHASIFDSKKYQMAQDFYRLAIESHPKTRIIQEEGDTYILSERIDNFVELPRDSKNLFSNGVITGLGEVLLLGLFLCDMNLNERYIGLNRKREVIKLHGRNCFDAKGHHINLLDIETLPFLESLKADQWLDVHEGLSNAPQFRLEVNRTILTLCLLTEEFIFCFFKAYAPDILRTDPAILFVIQRQKELISAALRNRSFRDYLLQERVKYQVSERIKSLLSFRTSENQCIVSFLDGNHSLLFNNAKLQFKTLMQSIELERMVIKISSFSVGNQDQLLSDFVPRMKNEIHDAIDSQAEMQRLGSTLTAVLNSVSSKEVQDVKRVIGDLKVSFWSSSRGKACAIETALINTPLESRGSVLSERASNEVKRALAAHTSFWKKHKVYQTVDEGLDYGNAADSYKKLIDAPKVD